MAFFVVELILPQIAKWYRLPDFFQSFPLSVAGGDLPMSATVEEGERKANAKKPSEACFTCRNP
jgi:hypothetical protein